MKYSEILPLTLITSSCYGGLYFLDKHLKNCIKTLSQQILSYDKDYQEKKKLLLDKNDYVYNSLTKEIHNPNNHHIYYFAPFYHLTKIIPYSDIYNNENFKNMVYDSINEIENDKTLAKSDFNFLYIANVDSRNIHNPFSYSFFNKFAKEILFSNYDSTIVNNQIYLPGKTANGYKYIRIGIMYSDKLVETNGFYTCDLIFNDKIVNKFKNMYLKTFIKESFKNKNDPEHPYNNIPIVQYGFFNNIINLGTLRNLHQNGKLKKKFDDDSYTVCNDYFGNYKDLIILGGKNYKCSYHIKDHIKFKLSK